jgi:hypothetical protein
VGDVLTAVVLLLTLSLLAVGEFEALDALAKPHSANVYAKNVFIAIAVGVVLICFFALTGPMPEEDRYVGRHYSGELEKEGDAPAMPEEDRSA